MITILSTKKLRPAIIAMAEKTGLQIIGEDFISIHFPEDEKVTEKLHTLKEHLVFTSSNGVKGFLRHLEKTGYPLSPKKVFCLEGETRQALEQVPGMEIVATAAYGRDLAARIAEQKTIKAVSFICGTLRRDVLPEYLKAHKIKVSEWVVYDTLLTGKLIREAYQGILFFSPSAARSFFQTNVLPKGVICFCIGETTADAVKEFTQNRVIVAENVTQESMLKAVEDCFSNKLKINSK